MSPISPEYAKAGGRSSAATREISSQTTTDFKSPFDVLYRKTEESSSPKTVRIRTEQGTIVRFPDDWHKKSGRKGPDASRSSAESEAPRFILGNYSPSADLPDTLASLPGYRHGSK